MHRVVWITVRKSDHRQHQAGFSLLELMIALTVGLLLLSGLLTLFNSTKQTYQWNTQLARLQENGRLAMELLTREIRHTGYWGCTGQSTLNNLLVTPNNLSWLTIERIHGYDHLQPGSLPSALQGLAVPGNDVIVLSGMDFSQRTLASHDACAAQFTLAQTHDLQANELVALSDCQQTVLLQITQANGSNRTLNHAASGGSIGNRSDCLGGDCSGSCASSWYQFAPGTPLAPLRSIAFFVGNSANGEPALFWQLLNRSDTPSRNELVEGVENMQILYGFDSDGDRVANQYLRADQVDSANGWNNIVSVRIALLLRSADHMRSQVDDKSYTLADTRIAPDTPLASHPADNRHRLVATSTIQLRD
ncbi:MAG: PilW family protein [Magnetococcales bacterium]|nr:PilW family protein [Magnetococcales bacterium]